MLCKGQLVILLTVCVMVGTASEVPLLQAADVETWSLTCNSSSIPVTFWNEDFISYVQLSVVKDNSNSIPLVNYFRPDQSISENEGLINDTTFPAPSYFARGNNTNNTSVFLQLVTVGHPHCSSQRPLLGSVESRLRNLDYRCNFTGQFHHIHGSQNTTPAFAARNYTKLVCCIGDGCGRDGGNGADNGVITDRRADDSYLEIAIWHIRDNNVRLCRVTNGVVRLKLYGDVFYEGSLNDTGARLECHVPIELDCAEFQCQVITSTSKTLTRSLKHPKFNENQYCQRAADSPLGSATQGWMIPVAVAAPLGVAFGVAITVTAALLVYRHIRRGSTQNPQSPTSQRTSETQEGLPLNASDDNDNGHNG